MEAPPVLEGHGEGEHEGALAAGAAQHTEGHVAPHVGEEGARQVTWTQGKPTNSQILKSTNKAHVFVTFSDS